MDRNKTNLPGPAANASSAPSDSDSELEDSGTVSAILEEIQDKEHSGYSFENADGSFNLIVRRHLGRYKPVFDPIYYRIYALNNEEYSLAKGISEGLIEAAVKRV